MGSIYSHHSIDPIRFTDECRHCLEAGTSAQNATWSASGRSSIAYAEIHADYNNGTRVADAFRNDVQLWSLTTGENYEARDPPGELGLSPVAKRKPLPRRRMSADEEIIAAYVKGPRCQASLMPLR